MKNKNEWYKIKNIAKKKGKCIVATDGLRSQTKAFS